MVALQCSACETAVMKRVWSAQNGALRAGLPSNGSSGVTPGGTDELNPLDKQIAATALINDLTVVIRNTAHYVPTGVQVLNPFTE